MKLTALLGIGAFAAGMLGAMPAEAQRYGHDGSDRHDGRRIHGDRGNFRHDGYRTRHQDRGGYGYRGGAGYRHAYGGRGYYGHSRVVCRVRPGRYGPVRRCFRAY